jgi:hypothetical protein
MSKTFIKPEQFSQNDVKIRIDGAMKEFMENDSQLLELCADERAATHQIACYLKNYFRGWNVDCEYNRRGREIKRILGRRKRPDIIIHHRGIPENLVVIEVKKSDNADEDIEKDRTKLIKFTKHNGDYKYKFGLLLILSTETPYSVHEEWYEEGIPIHAYDSIVQLEGIR